MKNHLSHLFILTAFSLLTAGAASAQSTITTTTRSVTSSDGTVSEFSPTLITVRSGEAAPIAYASSKTTTYVDENGNPVSVETVRSGVPVTVYYSQDGSTMTASKVVVHRVETTSPAPADPTTVVKKTTTTTTTTTAPPAP